MKRKATENNPFSCRHNVNGGRKAVHKQVGVGDKVFVKSDKLQPLGAQPPDQSSKEVLKKVDMINVVRVLAVVLLVLGVLFNW